MDDSPDLRDLRAALALVRKGGFAGAAAEMGISQPAVSARIAKLEQTFGFSLFHRRPEGTTLTAEGEALISHIEEIDSEFSALLGRLSYWKRAHGNTVRILVDGSLVSQNLRLKSATLNRKSVNECWMEIPPDADWARSLTQYGADVVLAGTFLGKSGLSGISTVCLLLQDGVTTAWNPEYHIFTAARRNFRDAIKSTTILPAEPMAMGFEAFINAWCETAYGFTFADAITADTEADAISACKDGVGILVLPGDAEARLRLRSHGLESSHSFKNVLPRAYSYGISYRAEERNPNVIAVVERLRRNDPMFG